jgi:HD-like signal output (HDOD) protein
MSVREEPVLARDEPVAQVPEATLPAEAIEPPRFERLEEFEERIRQLDTLPVLPVILTQLMGCLERPSAEVDFDQVVRLISRDESIAAQCVRLANSAMFGRRRLVETVHEAVIGLGLWRVSDLVFSCTLPHTFDPFPKALDRTTFWRHALGCALVSQQLARLVRSHSADKAYLAGLLHDLGLLVNASVLPELALEVFESAAAKSVALDEVEKQILGFTHADSGRILGQAWRLSPDILAALQFHHDVEAAPVAKDLVALVHLSDLFCREHGLGYGYYEARRIDFTCSPAWLILVQTCRQMGRPQLTRFFGELEEYFGQVLQFVDGVFGPARPLPAKANAR